MKNVIVLFGGDSDEKEISKLSADSIIKILIPQSLMHN